MSNKLKIGYTGPSKFSQEVQDMIETYFKAIPVYVNQNGDEDITYILSGLNGLVLGGGVDICPTTYNQEISNHHSLTKFDIKRDRREIFAIQYCLDNKIPMLGICRGHQMLGIFNGLPFSKDISGSEVCHSPGGSGIEMDNEPCHFVYIDDKKRSETFFKKEFVNSFHHQAVRFVTSFEYEKHGVEVIGHSYLQYQTKQQDARKIVELMKSVDNQWISCQWHPEDDFKKSKASQSVLAQFEKMLGR